ncbi:MAG: acyl-CoA carboxylase subunit epsilon [Oryzihumus sp.]
MTGAEETERPPLFVVKGDATPEEVAALTAVLQGVAAAGASAAPARPRPEWGAPHRSLRSTLPSGPGAWRASGQPR